MSTSCSLRIIEDEIGERCFAEAGPTLLLRESERLPRHVDRILNAQTGRREHPSHDQLKKIRLDGEDSWHTPGQLIRGALRGSP